MSRAVLSGVILLLDVVAIAGNAVVIIAFLTNRKLRKPSGCYITNLAAADLCMSLVGIPIYVATVVRNAWPFGDYFCAVWTGVERVCSLVSNFAIVAICFDRYWLVTRSSNYLGHHTVRSARWRIAVTWIAAFLLRVPFVIFGALQTWRELAPLSVCDPRSIYDVPFQVGLYEYDTIYTLIATLGEFVIPLLLITVWGVQVYIYLEKREKQRLIKAVERSRAMSLDFSFPQRELAELREERRGSAQSRSSFWSKLLSPEATKKAGTNGRSRSQDTIAGPMSDLEEEQGEDRHTTEAADTRLLNGNVSCIWKKDDSCPQISSTVNIVLDCASSDASTRLWDEQTTISLRDDLSTSDTERGTGLYERNKSSIGPRKSVSLNVLEVPGFTGLSESTRFNQTSKSTPSIVLSTMCDHNVLSPPTVVRKGGSIPLQVSFSLDAEESIVQGECHECQKQSESEEKEGEEETSSNKLLQVNGKDKISLSVVSPVKRRIVREGSTSSCDFLDVPPRSHFRAQIASDSDAPNADSCAGSTAAGVVSGGVADSVSEVIEEVEQNETRNSSFSSCVSDLPDSISSIITVSEPASPGLRHTSNMDAEAIQRALNSRAKQRYRSYRRRALMTILLMVCVFVVFQLPYVLVSCVKSFCRNRCVSEVVYELANWWFWAKVLLNPFIYGYISPEFRRYSVAVLKCRFRGKN